MQNNTTRDTIKATVTITELATKLGFTVKANKIKSIYNDQEKSPSLHLYNETNTFKCFSTGKGGDLFKFYADVKNLDNDKDFKRIVTELGAMFGVYEFKDVKSVNIDLVHSKAELSLTKAPSSSLDNLSIFRDFFRLLLDNTTLYGRGLETLQKRGLNDNIKAISKISYLDLSEYEKINNLAINKFGIETLKSLNLIKKDGVGISKMYFDCLLIPFFNAKNELEYVQLRNLNYGVDGQFFNKTKYNFFTGINTPSDYNLDNIIEKIRTKEITSQDQIFISEGVIDCLTLQQDNKHAFAIVSASLDGKIGQDKWQELISSNAEIVLAFDNDTAGENLKEKVKTTLKNLGANKIKTVVLPEKIKDINDYFLEFKNLNFNIESVDIIQGFKPFKFNLDNLYLCTQELKSIKSFLTFKDKLKDKALEFYNGTVNAICARQGQGKTTLMLNLVVDFVQQDKKVLLITLEETERRLGIKLLALICYKLGYIPNLTAYFENMAYFIRQQLTRLNLGELEGLDDKLVKGVELLNENLTLISLKNDIGTFERILNELTNQGQNYDVIVIDYFQRINGAKGLTNSWETSKEVADKLLDLAIKLDTVMILGSQKNRMNKDETDTASISGGDGLSNVCNIMLDIQRENGANRSTVTNIKDRESQFLTQTKATIEITDNFIRQTTTNQTL
jgi:hypothetical protein